MQSSAVWVLFSAAVSWAVAINPKVQRRGGPPTVGIFSGHLISQFEWENHYDFVVGIVWLKRLPDGSVIDYICTGVGYFNHVLTAAHCLNGAVTMDVVAARQKHVVPQWWQNPFWDTDEPGDDIGILRLNKPLTLRTAVEFQDMETRIGARLRVAGMGVRSPTTPIPPSPFRPVVNLWNTLEVVECTKYVLGVTCVKDSLLQQTCGGDSGAPWFRKTPGGAYLVAGVQSGSIFPGFPGPHPCGHPGWEGEFTSLSEYVDWVKSKMSCVPWTDDL